MRRSSSRDLPDLLELEILERAQDDIFNIIEYGTQTHGEDVARAYIGKIGARINWLRENPRLGPVHSELQGGIRSFRQGQHRIYYRSNSAKLTVIRVLHLAMDVPSQFD